MSTKQPINIVVQTLGHTRNFNYRVVADGVELEVFDSLFFAKRYAKRIRKHGVPPVGRVVFRA